MIMWEYFIQRTNCPKKSTLGKKFPVLENMWQGKTAWVLSRTHKTLFCLEKDKIML